jgi:hypothetical protein
MRPLKLTILFILTVFSAYSQKDNTDELISKLNNEMLIGTCHYNWVLENGSKEVDTLIAIGKQSGQDKTKLCLKLYDLLTDTTKGIISHYVLTNILYANNIKSGSFFYDDEDSTCEYNYNGLRFYENKYRRMFTDNSELEHNKKIWTVILKNMKVLN